MHTDLPSPKDMTYLFVDCDIHLHVCMYACMHTHICTYAYTHMHICIHTCMYMCMHTDLPSPKDMTYLFVDCMSLPFHSSFLRPFFSPHASLPLISSSISCCVCGSVLHICTQTRMHASLPLITSSISCYVCIYMCVCVCMLYTYIYMHTTRMYASLPLISSSISCRVYVYYACVYINIYIHACIHMYVDTYMHTYIPPLRHNPAFPPFFGLYAT